MKAVAYQQALPITDTKSLQDVVLPDPTPKGRELLVEVKAVSVNPVDTKIRKGVNPADNQWKVLGWDAAGIVREVGAEVSLFRPGDKIWYAGDISKPGSNSELQIVDERIVGNMPKTLSFAQSAALPLTAITAWELLFDRFQIPTSKQFLQQQLLIIGAGGGVGSIMTQLARRLTGITIIGTASRPETTEWVKSLGAHHVINHNQSIAEGIRNLGFDHITHIASLTQTDTHYLNIVEVIAPQGKFALIDDPAPFDASKLKRKSVSLHWELMFTRSLYQTSDMIAQHNLLNEVSNLVDEGLIKTTLSENFGKINAENLKKAHTLIESGKTKGKIVLEGF